MGMEMNTTRELFADGRADMIAAFAELTTLAMRAAADEDAVTALHGRFFDGNVKVKRAFNVALLFAEMLPGTQDSKKRPRSTQPEGQGSGGRSAATSRYSPPITARWGCPQSSRSSPPGPT
jgi:hypothetical protein